MSANERTGFLNNWQRLGFDRPAAPGEWVVTVVNNRADRVSRSEVFAGVVVDDAAAHAHFLIGTNLAGLRGYIATALSASTRRFQLFHAEERTSPIDQQRSRALDRAARHAGRRTLEDVGPIRLAQEAQAMASGLGLEIAVPAEPFAHLLAQAVSTAGRCPDLQAGLAASLPRALGPFSAALGDRAPEALAFLAREAARHAAVMAWQRSIDPTSPRSQAAAEASFRALYADLFRAGLIVLPDPHLTGDQIVDALARACPPGYA
jgi:hypothetical protein